jgi:hypothetical protein
MTKTQIDASPQSQAVSKIKALCQAAPRGAV